MSILLVPYNDSMRLGMGFNSYTQTMCSDNAVKVETKELVRGNDPSQVVTYSSKIVDTLSEVVGSMNVSYSGSIKKGTVEIAGSTSSINEDKIKRSDINAVVSVKVVNQTTIVSADSQFQPLENIVIGSREFDAAFGDCYISGFIEGGDFNGIISMRVMDRSQVESTVSAIKKSVSTGSGKDFTLDMDSFSLGSSGSNSMKETETTISVAWMGGGQIKDPKVKWDLDSVFAAAAAFPSQVAKCPQRTWAILTPYKANRSFQKLVNQSLFSPLEYDAVASYTVELFENFMEYKQLTRLVQEIMNNPSNYKAQSEKHNSIPMHVQTLVAVKAAFRQEMNKIVQVVDVLSRDPNILKRNAARSLESHDSVVRSIIQEACSADAWQTFDPQMNKTTAGSNGIAITSSTVNGVNESDPVTNGISTKASAPALNGTTTDTTVARQQERESINFQFPKLIAPEIWADLLPTAVVNEPTVDATAAIMPSAVASKFAHPDQDEGVKAMEKHKKLTILAAVCGLNDVTDALQEMVEKDQTLSIVASKIYDLVRKSATKDGQRDMPRQLGFIYQYTDQPMCLRMVKDPSGADKDLLISVNPSSPDLVVKPSEWNADTWSITAVTWGGKCFNDSPNFMERIKGQIRSNYNDGAGSRAVLFDNSVLECEDPWYGVCKLGMIFYQIRPEGKMHVAVGVEETANAIMTDNVCSSILGGTTTIANLQSDLEAKAEENVSLQDDLATKVDEIARLHGDIERKNQEVENLHVDQERKIQDTARLQSDLESKNRETTNLQQILDTKVRDYENLRNDLDNKHREVQQLHTDREVRDHEIENLRAEMRRRDEEFSRLREELDRKNRDFDNLRSRLPPFFNIQ